MEEHKLRYFCKEINYDIEQESRLYINFVNEPFRLKLAKTLTFLICVHTNPIL